MVEIGFEKIFDEEPVFKAEEHVKNYFKIIQKQAKEIYSCAREAKKLGIDSKNFVESSPAVDLADRAETIIGMKGLAQKYRDIFAEKKDRRMAYFEIFKQILSKEFGDLPTDEKRVEIGIKACLLIETEGVVVSPLDGLPKICISPNPDGSKYIDIYFSGPIRAAGGSATVIPLLLGDYARVKLGLDRYKPTNDEIERYAEELEIYQTEVVSRQLLMTAEQIKLIVKNCPVCINGPPTESIEVSAHRDLTRIPTNRIRGGVGLVITEGLALKAAWVMRAAKNYGLDWDFLEKFVKVEKKQSTIEIKPNGAYLDRLAAGRPILSYPSRWGGFRLRYGRGRNTGIMAKAVNPTTMILLDEYIAVGTHGKMERPGKATQFFPCTTIDGPIVLLDDGSVEKINDFKRSLEIKHRIKKIIYLGDLLASYGDFKKSNTPIIPAGYCEEWWAQELKKAINENEETSATKRKKITEECGEEFLNLLKKLIKNPYNVSEENAIKISEVVEIPLHPNYVHYYKALKINEIKEIQEAISKGKIETINTITNLPTEAEKAFKIKQENEVNSNPNYNNPADKSKVTYNFNVVEQTTNNTNSINENKNFGVTPQTNTENQTETQSQLQSQIQTQTQTISQPQEQPPETNICNPTILTSSEITLELLIENTPTIKAHLEKIGAPHYLKFDKISFGKYSKTMAKTFGFEKKSIKLEKENNETENVLDYLTQLSGLKIRDKAGSFIGGRIGRPEQAKERVMKGNPHVLYPIGLSGGSTRNILKAIDNTYNPGGKVNSEIAEFACVVCKKIGHYIVCECGGATKKLNYCRECKKSIAFDKCPKCGQDARSAGMQEINLLKDLEVAKNNLKEPLPDLIKGVKGMISETKEVELLEKGILRAKHKVHIFRDGTSRFELLNAVITHFKPREINLSVEKVIELGYTKDIEGNPITNTEQIIEIFPQDIIVNETCGDWLLKVSKFVDDELEKIYHQKRFYNATTKEQLIGCLTLGLAPHTSAAVVSRVLGYTKARLGFGHPYFVCAKRRNVDGDQDSLMLMMDTLLNFSQSYLSPKSGGKMDSALVCTILINPTEIDDEVHNMERCSEYSTDFYEKALAICEPKLDFIETVGQKLNTEKQYSGIGFTHDTNIFDEGPKTCKYITMKSMHEKIQGQNVIQKKIMAVDYKDALERVMSSHFLPDIIGNARSFSRQTFRCSTCNEIFRRIPLSGKCMKCGKTTIILTIHEGSVRKYLKIAQVMARQEELSPYLIQRLDMIEKEIDSVFKSDNPEQKSLFEFA
jgi:DNA polymerase II large subunit